MPNAGIHGRRSTNWKLADPPSNHTQIDTVTTNATSEIASVTHRITPSRRPSALGMNSRSNAPTSGTSQERLSSTQTPNAQRPKPNLPNVNWELGVGGWKLTEYLSP